MLHPRSIAALCCTFFAPGIVMALGLGNIDVTSPLGAPLKAEIVVINSSRIADNELIIKLANNIEFERLGVSRLPFLTQLKFELHTRQDGSQYIQIMSRDPVNEPFVNFVLEMQWANGQLLREYAILLDPPDFQLPGVSQPEEKPAESKDSSTTADNTRYYQTRSGDSLWRIANRLRPSDAVSVKQTMQALHELNRSAFINGNINLLKAEQRLRIPTENQTLNYRDQEARLYISDKITQGNLAIEAYQAPQLTTGINATEKIAPTLSVAESQLIPATPTPTTLPATPDQDLLRLVDPEEEQSLNQQDINQLKTTYNLLMEEKAGLLRIILQQYEELEVLKQKQARLDDEIRQQTSGIASTTTPESTQASSSQLVSAAISDHQKTSDLGTVMISKALPGTTNDVVFKHPAFIAAITTSAILFLTLLYLLIRRKNIDSHQALTANVVLANEQQTNPDIDTVIREPKQAPTLPVNLPDIDPLKIEDDPQAEQNDELDETIRAANIYLAYDRINEAKSLIKDALQLNPKREDLQLMLLELYCKERNSEAFDTQADLLNSSASTAVLNQVNQLRLIMGKSPVEPAVEPEAPLLEDTQDEVFLSDEELGLYPEESIIFTEANNIATLDLNDVSEQEWRDINQAQAPKEDNDKA